MNYHLKTIDRDTFRSNDLKSNFEKVPSHLKDDRELAELELNCGSEEFVYLQAYLTGSARKIENALQDYVQKTQKTRTSLWLVKLSLVSSLKGSSLE